MDVGKMANGSTQTVNGGKGGAAAPVANGSKPAVSTGGVKPPEGYKKSQSRVEVAGYWLPEKGPIHGKLVGAYDFRQKTGRGKGQIRRVYIVELADPCVARVLSEDGKGKKSYDEDTLKARELCGIFGSAGLRDLDDMGNTFIFAYPLIDEKTGKQAVKELESGNAMKLFEVVNKGTVKPLVVRQVTKPEDEAHGEAAGDTGDEELPF